MIEKKEREEIPSVDSMLKKLEKVSYKININEFLADLFECGAIAVSNKFDKSQADQREQRYMHTISKYDAEIQSLIVELFTDMCILITHQYDKSVGFNDYLGELYMKSETSNKHSGQFFTPYNVSKLCAACAVDREKVINAKINNEILTLHEPSCGSSGMIMATADVMYNECGFDITRNLFVECSDIDSRCVHMTYLQLGLAGIPAIIYKRDTLTMQTWERWETPALIMQWLRFRKYITESGGKK